MKCVSTSGEGSQVSLGEAILAGATNDGRLFVPTPFPRLSEEELTSLRGRALVDVALSVLAPFFSGELDADALRGVVTRAFSFPVPLVSITPGISVAELFHGPTGAFKDFGARFLAELVPLLREDARPLCVVVATSGDTGGAVGAAFSAVPGAVGVILFPKGQVSALQERQLTTLGPKIVACEVDGSFDDCQRLAKEILRNEQVRSTFRITTANSINLGRLLPQIVYYAWTWCQVEAEGTSRAIVVPSGNLGNITAAAWCRALGFDLGGLVAAHNVNAPLVGYLQSGVWSPGQSYPTISNAMDVGSPSNFERLRISASPRGTALNDRFFAYSFTDEETLVALRDTYAASGYVADPHTAVGIAAAKRHLELGRASSAVVMGTAHPAKFGDTVRRAIGIDPEIPPELGEVFRKTSAKVSIGVNVNSVVRVIEQLHLP